MEIEYKYVFLHTVLPTGKWLGMSFTPAVGTEKEATLNVQTIIL